MSWRKVFPFIVSMLCASVALANPAGDYVVVVPINPGVVFGANGTQWTTSLFITNGSDKDTVIDCDDPPPAGCPTLKAHSTLQLTAPPYRGVTHDGVLLRIATGFLLDPVPADAITVELRATDSASAPHSAGTEIPVARPSDFKKTALVLAPVPINGHSRAQLRLYGTANGSAIVRVFGVTSGTKLLETTVALTGGMTTNAPFGTALPSPPSFATLALPAFATSDDSVRIEVVPVDPIALWGFASVTDNASEQFTIISPTAGYDYMAISVA